MPTPPRAAVLTGLLLLTTVFGAVAVASTPEGGRGLGLWPCALLTAVLILAPERTRWALVAVGAVLAVASVRIGGRPLDVAVGLGLGLALESSVTWRVLTRGEAGRPPLRTLPELARFLVAALAGSTVIAGAAVATSAVTGWSEPLLLAVTVATASLAAQTTLLPLFCVWRLQPASAGRVEQASQWVILLAATLAVFVPTDFPTPVLLVLPALVWGAVRNSRLAAFAQMILVVGVAILLTTAGLGPLARPEERYDVPPDVQGILLATFATVCALVVLTLNLTVGEQHEYARQVATERDRLRNVVDGISGVAIIGADLQGRITLFNPGAERLLGYTAEEVLGRPTRMLHSEQAVAEKAAELALPADFSKVATCLIGSGPTQMGFVRKDGAERQHRMSLNRVTDDRGNVTGYVSTSEDVTERLRAEAALVEALETERRAVEQLREVDRVKDTVISTVSHELRTPITSIIGYTELLEHGELGELTPQQRDAVRRIGGNSSRLLSLINDLLTLSRVQADGTHGTEPVVDLGEVVSAGLGVLAPIVASRHLRLDLALPDAPVPVRGDRDMLERVVINLTDNAVKFTPDGGDVTVAVSSQDEIAVLEVTDTGIGVPGHEQRRLFETFFRSTLAERNGIPGSGLGLAIARTIVERHGGTIAARSEPGRGSTFRVELPTAG